MRWGVSKLVLQLVRSWPLVLVMMSSAVKPFHQRLPLIATRMGDDGV
jgi:hypothetical protein